MSATQAIQLAITASLTLMVFGVGLQATPRDATFLFRHPGVLVRSVLSMNVVMPLAALWVAMVFGMHPAVKIALVALALAPVPPFLPGKAMKAGGASEYTIGLLTATSLIAIAGVPLSVWLLGALLDVSFRISAATVAKIVATTVLAPLLAGIAVRHVAPHLAARAARPVTLVATIVLVASMLPILFTAWPAIETLLGNGTVLAIIGLTLLGLGVGHVLGGPGRDDRTVLALSTAARHPAVALAIAGAMFPGQKLASAAILLDLIVSAVIAIPYVKRSAHVHSGDHGRGAAAEEALDISHAGRGRGGPR